MKTNENLLKLSILMVALLIGAGCANVKLAAIPQTREGYNQALSNSDNEQFLLNIVRLHFGQTPYFVNVDSMVTSSTLTTGSGGSLTSGVGTSAASPVTTPFWGITPQVTFAQTPTITYSPLQGSLFVSGMLAPISLDKLSLLLQSGWSTAEILKLAMEQIGSLNNGTAALHPLSNKNPEQEQYNKLVDTLDRIDLEDKLDFAITTYKGSPAATISFGDKDSAVEVAKLLHMKQPSMHLVFTNSEFPGDGSPENVIYVQTRSVFSMLNFLSKGVASSYETSRKYGIKNIVKASGTAHSDTSLTDGIFLVSESNKEPNNAMAKIQFDNHWYYIANDDVASKSTLILLRIAYSLQTGELKANLPLITIPTK